MKLWMTLLLTLAFSTKAQSVWQISKGENKLFLAGTMHLLKSEDYPLANAYDLAYQQADTLIFETDIGALNNFATQLQMMRQFMYQDGNDLSKVLDPDIYSAFIQQANTLGLGENQIKLFKPGAAGVMLAAQLYASLGYTAEGVDLYYFQKGEADSKTINWLETIEFQTELMANLGADMNPNELLKSTAEEMKYAKESIETLRQSWKQGDMQSLYTANKGFIELQPQIYEDLLFKRNDNWLPQIEVFLADKINTEMVLVGALHLAGERGLLEQLKQKGYQVEQLK